MQRRSRGANVIEKKDVLALQGLRNYYLEYVFGILPTLISALSGLCVSVYGSYYAVGAHGYAGYFRDALGDVVALVIASLAIPLSREWHGYDEVNALEEAACL